MSWARAFDRSRERVLETLANRVPEGAFSEHSFRDYVSPIPNFAASLFADSTENIFVNVLQQKAEVFAAEALSAHSKFHHSLACTNLLSKWGALTWSLLDAYHCALFGAKAILSSYGLSIFTVNGQSCLADLWPELGRRNEIQKFEKAYGKRDSLVRIERTGGTLGQRDIWSGLERVCRIGKSDNTEVEGRLEKIREIIALKPWQNRHSTLYSSDRWQWRDDIVMMQLPEKEVHARFLDGSDVSIVVELVDEMFSLLSLISGQFESVSGGVNVEGPAWISQISTPVAIHQPRAVPTI